MRAGKQKGASEFLDPVSINLKKLPRIAASGLFWSILQETCRNKGCVLICSFRLIARSGYQPERPCIILLCGRWPPQT